MTAGIAIYALALTTPLRSSLTWREIGVAEGLVLAAISYVIGALLSGPSKPITAMCSRISRTPDPRESPPPLGFGKEVMDVLNGVLVSNSDKKLVWSSRTFYLARALVRESMPIANSEIERQSALARFRENLVGAVVLWIVAGSTWGIGYWQQDRRIGITVVTLAFALGAGTILALVWRLQKNNARVVRELCAAILVGHAIGAFQRRVDTEHSGVK